VAPDLIATIIFFLQKTNDISELRNQLLGLQISPRFPKKPREESGVVVCCNAAAAAAGLVCIL
jgi:hypothetical protein